MVRCPECKQYFETDAALEKHKRSKLSKCFKHFKCSSCAKGFFTPQLLKQHQKYEHSGTQVCQNCGEIFANLRSLVNHHRVEQRKAQKPRTCQICGKDVRNYSNHVKMVHGQTHYPCPDCNKSFNHMKKLKAHIKRCHNPKPFKCEYCGKLYAMRSLLSNHIKQHTGERPWKCDICFKSFISRSQVNKHKKIHSEKYQYECEICEYTTYAKVNLVTHLRVHTGDKPYKCESCGQAFAHNVSRKQHIRKNHPAEIQRLIFDKDYLKIPKPDPQFRQFIEKNVQNWKPATLELPAAKIEGLPPNQNASPATPGETKGKVNQETNDSSAGTAPSPSSYIAASPKTLVKPEPLSISSTQIIKPETSSSSSSSFSSSSSSSSSSHTTAQSLLLKVPPTLPQQTLLPQSLPQSLQHPNLPQPALPPPNLPQPTLPQPTLPPPILPQPSLPQPMKIDIAVVRRPVTRRMSSAKKQRTDAGQPEGHTHSQFHENSIPPPPAMEPLQMSTVKHLTSSSSSPRPNHNVHVVVGVPVLSGEPLLKNHEIKTELQFSPPKQLHPILDHDGISPTMKGLESLDFGSPPQHQNGHTGRNHLPLRELEIGRVDFDSGDENINL